jgi:hypothetical protein
MHTAGWAANIPPLGVAAPGVVEDDDPARARQLLDQGLDLVIVDAFHQGIVVEVVDHRIPPMELKPLLV